MAVCNLLGNIYNKAYRSILGNIMMSNDGRICFIVVPDKNIMVNMTSVISWQPFFEFHVLPKNIHMDKSSTSAHISP